MRYSRQSVSDTHTHICSISLPGFTSSLHVLPFKGRWKQPPLSLLLTTQKHTCTHTEQMLSKACAEGLLWLAMAQKIGVELKRLPAICSCIEKIYEHLFSGDTSFLRSKSQRPACNSLKTGCSIQNRWLMDKPSAWERQTEWKACASQAHTLKLGAKENAQRERHPWAL